MNESMNAETQQLQVIPCQSNFFCDVPIYKHILMILFKMYDFFRIADYAVSMQKVFYVIYQFINKL